MADDPVGSKLAHTSTSGASPFETVIAQRPLPLGAVVGHAHTAVSNEFAPVTNDDYATFTAHYADRPLSAGISARHSGGYEWWRLGLRARLLYDGWRRQNSLYAVSSRP